MNIEVDPCAVVRGARSVQVEDLAFVPALVLLLHRRQVERGQAVGGVRIDSGRPPLVVLLHVWVVAFVPNVNGDLVVLETEKENGSWLLRGISTTFFI